MENTGKYGWLLIDVLSEINHCIYVVNPIHLKKSLGLIRGKNDKIDAFRIAQFIKKNYQELPIHKEKSSSLLTLQVLVSERQHKVKQRKSLLIKLRDYQLIDNTKLRELLIAQNQKLITEITDQIKMIEKQIVQVIKQEVFLNTDLNFLFDKILMHVQARLG